MACDLNVSIISITGDCSNTSIGSFSIDVDGTAPGFSLQWLSPYVTTIPLTTNPYTFTGLSAGTYSFYVTDSCVPTNGQTSPINVYISSGTCVEILSKTNTTCNLPNGSITVLNNNYYGNVFYELYETTLGLIQGLDSSLIISSQATFTQLNPGIYYVVSNDGGGCTGKTESCIIKSSTTLNFGLYTIPNAGCGIDSGSIYITGLTGTPPYSYLWSNNETTSYITGLTEGQYSVTVIDNSGCIQVGGVLLEKVAPLGITSITDVSPSCFGSDGEVTTFLTGGTAPYYFSGSNGETSITFANSYTFTGLSSGFFEVKVTDAGLCNSTASTSLFTPNSFSVLSVTTNNSFCNNSGGSIDIFLLGGSGEYTYSLTDSLGDTKSVIIPQTSYSFANLSSDTYTLSISNNGACTYSQNYTINNVNLFNLTTSVVGTTCNNSDGSVTLTISSGGTPPFFYQIDNQSVTTSLLSYTFSGLSSGNYFARVIDANFCEQTDNFLIPISSSVNFNLAGFGTSPGENNGIIYAFITSGEPPFSLNWSNNIPTGQTGYSLSGLSAGTYSLTITDDNGCTQSRDITLYGFRVISSYELFNVSNTNLEFTGELSKRGLQQYLIDGFFDLTSGDTGCLLEEALFEIETTLTGTTKSKIFYTGTTIFEYPSDNEMYDVIRDLVLEFLGINNVVINPLENTIIIESIKNPPIGLFDAQLSISLKINYKINCVTCS